MSKEVFEPPAGETTKIAIIGAPNVGKTALFDALTLEYPDADKTVVVHSMQANYFEINDIPEVYRMAPLVEEDLQNAARRGEEWAHSHNPELIICKRSVIDPIIYSAIGGHRFTVHRLHKRAENWLPTYSKIFLPDFADIPHQSNKDHPETPGLRMIIHRAFEKFLDKQKVPFEVLRGTPEERLERVKAELGQLALEP